METQVEARWAGCSAVSWATADGKHLFGRNFDFNRLARGSAVTALPRGTAYQTCSGRPETAATGHYAAIGVGLLAGPALPVLYDGVNEQGLMGAQLYYREFARFPREARPGARPVQPSMLVCHLLLQCASLDQAEAMLRQELSLVGEPMFGTVPPLHFAFSDRSGEMMIVEPDADGLRIYRATAGVMTNSPPYPWHRLNLLNYAGVRDLDYDALEFGGERLEQCFSGSGAQGLPGDWSAPSRFVRLAFLRKYAVPGRDEGQGVARLFRLMGSAAFPLGAVRVSQPGEATALDDGVVPYDYTVYTTVLCAESGRCYWTTYDDPRIRYAALEHLAGRREPVQFPLEQEPSFSCLSSGD